MGFNVSTKSRKWIGKAGREAIRCADFEIMFEEARAVDRLPHPAVVRAGQWLGP